MLPLPTPTTTSVKCCRQHAHLRAELEIAYITQSCGVESQALEDTGHSDDTLVVLLGDHGQILLDMCPSSWPWA